MRELYRLITGIHAHRNLTDTVQAVTDLVVQSVGFRVAAVSVMQDDGGLTTIAVAGSDAARSQLLGVHRPLSAYEEEFAVAELWGALRFVPHELVPDASRRGWVPEMPVSDIDNAWHPLDALYAPLYSSEGTLIGVLSVDLPRDDRRPSPAQCDLLEVLAVQAGVAIDNALLTGQLRAGEQIFREAFDRSAGGMALIAIARGKAGRFLRVNPAFCQIVGRTADQLLTCTSAELTHPEDVALDDEMFDDLIAGRSEVYRREKRYLDGAGRTVWVAVTATIARSADGNALCAVSQIEDISGRRAQLEQLHHEARHDPLTNLPNRTLVFERLTEAIKAARDHLEPGVVLFLDLDQFKSINDRHGHLVGDQVLAMLGQRIRSSVRIGDMVGRLGGDEFVVIADRLAAAEIPELVARVRAAVAAPITYKGSSMAVSISVGMCPIPVSGADPAQILRKADHDMYENKSRSGRRAE